MSREVHQVGQAPSDERVDSLALNVCRSLGVAVVAVINRGAGERRRNEQIVSIQDALNRVIDLGLDLLILEKVQKAHPIALLHPCEVLRREVVGMISNEIKTAAFEVLQCRQVESHNEPAPDITQFALMPRDIQ